MITALNRLFLLLGALFSITLFVLSGPIASLLHNPELETGLKIFSPFPLFTLPAMGVEGIYTALRKTRTIAIYNVVSKLFMLICIVVPVVLFHTGYKEAIIGWGVASFLIFLLAMYLKNRPYCHIKKELVEDFYKQVFDYCLPLVGAFVAGFFISSADQFFISRFWGTETFAEASNGCMSIPIAGMISSSVRAVLLPLFSKADAQGEMAQAVQTYNRAVSKCVVLVFPILLFCIFFAKDIMIFFYGEQYANSGAYLQIFTIRDFIGCLPYFSVLMAIGSTKFYMNMHFIGVLYIWITDYIFAQLGLPPTMFVAVSSSFQVGSAILAYLFIHKKTGIQLLNKTVISSIIRVALHCSIVLTLLLCLSSLIKFKLPLLVSIGIMGALYYLVLVLTSKIVHVDYLESIKLLRQ